MSIFGTRERKQHGIAGRSLPMRIFRSLEVEVSTTATIERKSLACFEESRNELT
jgi:hypothetical protein